MCVMVELGQVQLSRSSWNEGSKGKKRSDGQAGKGQVNWEWKGAHPPSWQGSRRGMGERRRKRGQAGRPARFMDLLGKAQRVGKVEQGPKSKRERKESSATVANLPDP